MDKHRILIVEDNFLFAVKLEKNLVEWGHEVLSILDSGANVFEFLKSETPTLILMDINLKGEFNGVDIANQISNKGIPIVFITGRTDEETFEAAKKTTTGITYLVKPFDMLTLRGAIDFNPFLQLEKSEKSERESVLFIRKNKELVKVKTEDISHIKSDRNYCDIFAGDKIFFLKISLTKLMEELPEESFIKIHRSYVVNLGDVDSVFLSTNQIKIKDKTLPIGRKYKKDFLARIEAHRLKN